MIARWQAAGESLVRMSWIVRVLLRTHRWLLLLLLCWPLVLSAVLLGIVRGAPEADDVRAMIDQERFYGLALVGLVSSAALGNEIRARRVQQVLGRAVGRTEYLLALAGSAFLPFVGYLAVVYASALALGMQPQVQTTSWIAEVATGLALALLGNLFSVLLPQPFAMGTTAAVLGVLAAAAAHGGNTLLAGFAEGGGTARIGSLWGSVAAPIAIGGLALCIASAVFRKRDLPRG